MFANASTGTAIATLNGAAKTNATLAWLGGGSKAAGGAGIVGGKIVLGGVVIGTIAVVGGLIASAQGRAKLAEAKRIHAEAESAVSKMNIVITGMEGIEKVSNNYVGFISNLSTLFTSYLKEMDTIATRYKRGGDGKIDYNDLSEMEQRTLHLSWLLAQLYYRILSMPILNDHGEIEPSSRRLLQKAQQDYASLSGQASDLENEKREIDELLSSAKVEFDNSVKDFYIKKQGTCAALINIGKRRIDLWEKSLSPFMLALTYFENISVNNMYPYIVTDIPIEFIFERGESVLSCIRRLKTNSIDSLGNTGFVEVALFGGEDFLSELFQAMVGKINLSSVHRHEMSLWFTGDMSSTLARNIPFAGVSDNYISAVKQTVDGISRRENLEQATAIYQEVMQLSGKISTAIADFDMTTKKMKNMETVIKKYNKIQSGFLSEIETIRKRRQSCNGVIPYNSLLESEKRVFEMSFIVAKMQYTILASCMLQESNGGDADDSDIVIETVNNVYQLLKKDSFKMSDINDELIVNVLWKKEAHIAFISGFTTSTICILLAIVQLVSGNLWGLIEFLASAIAFPFFFYFKNMTQNKLFVWRYIRVGIAIIFTIVVQLLGMVV